MLYKVYRYFKQIKVVCHECHLFVIVHVQNDFDKKLAKTS